MSNLRRYMQQESGTALLASALLVVLLTGAGMAAVMTTSVNQNASKNVLTSKQAFYLADAGIQHAKTFLTQNQSNWTTYASAQAKALPLSNTSLSTGGYSVTAQDGSNGSLLITSTGTAAGNAQAVVQSVVTKTGTPASTYTPRYALIAGVVAGGSDSFSIGGGNGTTATIHGGVHANGYLWITSKPNIYGDATGKTFSDAFAGPTYYPPGVHGGGYPAEPLPSITPTDLPNCFRGKQDYWLASDGNVYNKQGQPQPMPSGKWNNWSFGPYVYNGVTYQAWTMSANATLNANLYVEPNVYIAGAPGTTSNPWITSIITPGSIYASNSGIVARAPVSTDGSLFHPETKDLLFLAGGDIYLAGGGGNNSGRVFTGLMIAYEQVWIDVAMTLNGAAVAMSVVDVSPAVKGMPMFLSSGANVTYNGNMGFPLPCGGGGTGTTQIMTWMRR